jgi:cytochrome c
MRHAVGVALAGMAVVSMAAGAMAQAGADPANGRVIAQRVCGECHAIDGGSPSPHPQAPTFVMVANAPGRTGTSLRVWFQSPHRSMPDFNLGEQGSDDLVAYILSLKKRP